MITPDIALICLSRRRSDSIVRQTLRFFPEATLCVAEEERDDYHKLTKRELMLHPDDVEGVGPIRQWALNRVDSQYVVLVADDIVSCYGLTTTFATRITDPAAIWNLVLNTAECAEAAGCKMFGFNQAWDVRKFSPLQPFTLNGWCDGVIGMLDRQLQFDPMGKLHPDVDFCLQQLKVHRKLWIDNRFSFAHDRWKQKGGNAHLRSKEAHQREFDYLTRKWGKALTIRWAKSTFLSKIHVERKQSII